MRGGIYSHDLNVTRKQRKTFFTGIKIRVTSHDKEWGSVKRHWVAPFTTGWRFPSQRRESAWIKCDRPNVCSIATEGFLPLLKVLAFSNPFPTLSIPRCTGREGRRLQCVDHSTIWSGASGEKKPAVQIWPTASPGGKLGPASRVRPALWPLQF